MEEEGNEKGWNAVAGLFEFDDSVVLPGVPFPCLGPLVIILT